MRWLAPELLWSLLLLPLAVGAYVWAWRRRKRQVVVFSTVRVLMTAQPSSLRTVTGTWVPSAWNRRVMPIFCVMTPVRT